MQYLNPNKEPYYFGRLLPLEAEKILIKAGKTDGLFLLRDKWNTIGSYALSICFKDKITHYAIERQVNQTVKIAGSNEFIGPVELINFFVNDTTQNVSLCAKPFYKCLRNVNTKPVSYLFISSQSFQKATENHINKCRPEKAIDAKGRLFYKYEKLALIDIHLSQKWCLKDKSSMEVEKMFKNHGFFDGKFLLRYSFRFLTYKYKLSICYKNIIYHHTIVFKNDKYTLEKEVYDARKMFDHIAQLIDYYGREKGCLESILTLPYDADSRNSLNFCDTNQNYKILMQENDNNAATLIPPYLKFISRLASGPIAHLYLAQYRYSEFSNIVAVKFLIKQSNEVEILNRLEDHPHIVQTISIVNNLKIYLRHDGCHNSMQMIGGLSELNIYKIIRDFDCGENFKHQRIHEISYNVMEYSNYGTLNKYLQNSEDSIGNVEILQYIQQILSALEYIAGKKIVHRNVSARNVLLFDNKVVKIGGFGLAKFIDTPNDSIVVVEKDDFPCRWYPPEAFEDIFSEKTDVWSFGVLLWELCSHGQRPYNEITLNTKEDKQNFVENLKAGLLTLDKPQYCSYDFYVLMKHCWRLNANMRPTFKEINAEYNQYLIITETNL